MSQIKNQQKILDLIYMTIQQMQLNQTVVSADTEEIKILEEFHDNVKNKLETMLNDIIDLNSQDEGMNPKVSENNDSSEDALCTETSAANTS